MQTVAVVEPGRIEVLAVPRPSARPAPGMVRVEMLAVGICGTDVTIAGGGRELPQLPWGLGHEGVGRIIEVGDVGGGLDAGDLVALEPNITCGRCRFCRLGRTSACVRRESAGVLTQPGFLAEVVDHPAGFCHPIPMGTPVEQAVCAEPLAVAAAALRRTELTGDEEVLVLGAGAQGLLTVLLLLSRGITPVVSEPVRERRELAIAFGATAYDPPASPRPSCVIDAAGVPEALGSVLEHLDPFTKVTVIGESSRALGLSSFDLVQRELLLRGSFIYEHLSDMRDAVRLLPRLRTDRILAPALSLADAADLLSGTARQDPVRKAWVDLRP